MNIINLIIGLAYQYWLDALIILFVIGLLIVLWRFGKKDFVKCIITELVARAEQLYGSGSGQVKLAFVLSELYKKLPFAVRLVFTEQELRQYIEEAAAWLKKKLTANDTYLLSYTDEKVLNGYNRDERNQIT